MADNLHDAIVFPVLKPEHIEALMEYGTELCLEDGQVLFAEGDPADDFYILLEGELKITKCIGGIETMIVIHKPGEFTGELSLLTEGSLCIATGRAISHCRALKITSETLKDLINKCPILGDTVIRAMAGRVKDVEALTQQREKMAALGKLSAGLAHELNNPAAAGQRATAQLRETFSALSPLALKLGCYQFSDEQRSFLKQFIAEAKTAAMLDPLARSDREELITEWLESYAIPEAWKLAPTLVEAGLSEAQLDSLASTVDTKALADVLVWLDSTLAINRLLDEVDQSTGRISELVKAVKSYSYMDQAPLQEVDIHEGIETTLTMLGHELKHGIEVIRDYDRTLPRIPVYGSELNQVWTNLIDNAADALQGKGHITIRTRREADQVLVEIIDDGPGIPPEMQSLIFDPFFTTKPVGEGTGLGLETSRRIVMQRHHGDLRVSSQSGNTNFQVRLPLTYAKK